MTRQPMDAAALRQSGEQPFADRQRPASKRQRRPKQPPPDPNADLLRAAMPQLVFGFLTVADLLDPAGARRRQEQAEQPKLTQTTDCTPPPGWWEEHQRHMDAWDAARRRQVAQKAAQTRKERRARQGKPPR